MSPGADQPAKLKIGLLLDSYAVPRWQHEIIRRIVTSDYAEVTMVVLNQPAPPRASGVLQKILRHKTRIGVIVIRRVVLALERFLVDRGTHAEHPLQITDTAELIGDVENRMVNPRCTKFSDFIEGEDLEWIRARTPEVMIRFGFRILRGEVLNLPHCGVWSLHHGDNRVNRGGPAGFWESTESWPVTGATLQIIDETLDGGLAIGRTWTSSHDQSTTYNLEQILWRSVPLIPRALAELHRIGPDAFLARHQHENRDPQIYSAPLFVAPRTPKRLAMIWKRGLVKLKRRISNALYFDQWILMYHLGDSYRTPMYKFRRMEPPKDRFWGDPHICSRDGKHYVFLEEYLYSTNKGHISVVTIDAKGPTAAPVPVLERPYHLSYPHVFDHDGTTYMIPESAENGTVELYEATDFPHSWTFKMNLMENIQAYDATVVFARGRWWMFATLEDPPGSSTWDELFLFSSDTLLSNSWTPHPMNPIVSDVRSARPAGRIFEYQGSLYRPSQNSSYRYGYGFNLHRIVQLTPDTYQEEMVTSVEPDWDPNVVATHTFNRVPGLTVIDAQLRTRRK